MPGRRTSAIVRFVYFYLAKAQLIVLNGKWMNKKAQVRSTESIAPLNIQQKPNSLSLFMQKSQLAVQEVRLQLNCPEEASFPVKQNR